jgi:hypothetical protein
MTIQPVPICIGCGKCPDELKEYADAAREEDLSPDQYVRCEEGTYNPENGHFACTDCWIAMGCPTAPGRGWRAP